MSHYSTSMKYEIPEEAFADPLNPTVEEVYTWASNPTNIKASNLHGALIVFEEVGDNYKYIWRTIDTGDDFTILNLKTLITPEEIEDAGAIMSTSDQSIDNIKTFNESPIVPIPTTDFQAANMKYVDDAVSAASGGMSFAQIYSITTLI